MLYHFNIFLSSSLIREPRVLCRYRRKNTLNLINVKGYFRRPLTYSSLLPVTHGPFRLTKVTSGNGIRDYTDFLSARVCTWMYLDVSILSRLGHFLRTSHDWVTGKLEWSTCRSALMLPPREDLPRNRLVNVFNIGKTSSGSENETTRHKFIKIVFSWFTRFIFSPAPAQICPSGLGDSCCCCALVPLGGTEGIEICCRTCTNTSNVSQVWWSLPWRVSACTAKLYCWKRNKPVNQTACPE